MKKLIIAPSLNLPLDAVTQKLGIIGRTGSGKSYMASLLAEQMLYSNAQVVVLDPVGVWWGLRLDADGKSPGISIPVFGGLHGDIPLEPTAGKIIADLIVDKGISAVIDVSQFESDSDKSKFSTDFADRFYYRKKSSSSAVHVFIEECQEFIPQNIQRGEERMLHAFQRMIRLGRNFGIGATLITQRPQDVNKKALNQAECVFAFQLTGPQERKAIDVWMNDKGLDLDLANDLPKLSVGEAHIWSPAWLKISKVVKIGKKKTFNASSTPEVGKRSRSHNLAEIDLDSLLEQMKGTIDRAKAEDPKLLKKRIQELETELKKRPAIKPEIKKIEVPVLKDAQISKMCNALSGLSDNMKKAMDIMNPMLQELRNWNPSNADLKMLNATIDLQRDNRIDLKKSIPVKQDKKVHAEASGNLPVGEEKILSALIQYPNGLHRNQLTVLTGYKRSSRDAYIARLSQKNLVESNGGKVIVTELGITSLPMYKPLPIGEELQQYWFGNLPSGESLILKVLVNNYPNAISRDDLDESTGFKRSSRDAYLARLSAKELIEIAGAGMVKASSNLF